MIIAVCTDDIMVDDIVSHAAKANTGTFGRGYKVFDKSIPDLGSLENLFLVAHGAAFGDENQPVIGSKKDDFYLTAKDLYTNLPIFPYDYAGSVYVYSCESASPGEKGVSFVRAMQDVMSGSYPSLSAYGQIGKPSGPIPAPNSHSWIKA